MFVYILYIRISIDIYIKSGAAREQSVQRSATFRTTKFRFPARARDFSQFYSVQTSPGCLAASYPMGTVALSPGVKRRGLDHSPPSNTEVKNGSYAFMA
jgi:hypothetical protein